MTEDIGIAHKWPAARLYGPPVMVDDALEFIRRTDAALVEPMHASNDREFNEELRELLGFPDTDTLYSKSEIGKVRDFFEASERFREAFGHVDLNYLSSHWVATCYIGGPHGPVHPNGEVSLAINFGKWPSVEDVESDLSTITREFPWLSFELFLWDHPDEADAVDLRDPTHGWGVTKNVGFIRYSHPVEKLNRSRLPQPYSLEQTIARIMSHSFRSETTWPVKWIEHKWGEHIKQARDAAGFDYENNPVI